MKKAKEAEETRKWQRLGNKNEKKKEKQVHKGHHRNLKTEQNKTEQKLRVIACIPEGYADPVSIDAPAIYLRSKRCMKIHIESKI